jgi:uncharacterized protein (TIGR02118 family)
MVVMSILLDRREDMSHEEFVTYWREEHAPLVEAMPGLQRYAIRLPTAPERSSYDGVAELTFEDTETMRAAFESEAGQAVEADAEQFVGDDVTLVTEEEVVVDHADPAGSEP